LTSQREKLINHMLGVRRQGISTAFATRPAGSFDILLDDGFQTKKYHLNRSYFGVYICPLIWRYLNNFSSGAVCMVLASESYDEADYIRNREDFLKAVGAP